jgi:hypothetical protein
MHIIRHESGHVLGLCQNTAHGDGAHCAKHGCLMYPMPDWLSRLGLKNSTAAAIVSTLFPCRFVNGMAAGSESGKREAERCRLDAHHRPWDRAPDTAREVTGQFEVEGQVALDQLRQRPE